MSSIEFVIWWLIAGFIGGILIFINTWLNGKFVVRVGDVVSITLWSLLCGYLTFIFAVIITIINFVQDWKDEWFNIVIYDPFKKERKNVK